MSINIKASDPDPVYILRSDSKSISALKFTVFGTERIEVLISGSQDGVIQIWDLRSRRVKLKLETCYGQSVLFGDVIQLDSQDIIISHGRNGIVQFWYHCHRSDEWKIKKTLEVYEYGFCPISLCEQGQTYWLAYSSSGNSQFSITSVDLDPSKNFSNVLNMKCKEKLGIVMHIKLFCYDKDFLGLVGYEDGSVALWDLLTGTSFCCTKVHRDPIMCIAIDKKSLKVISGSADHTLKILQIDHNMQLQICDSHDSMTSGFACASIRKDGRIAVCGGWDGKLRVFGWKKLKPLAILKYHTEIVNNVCFGETNLIAAASKDGRISIWNVYQYD